MPTLPELAQYNAGQTIQFAQAGQKQRTLADLGQYAAKGDYQGAASAAFSGGQPDIGAALAKMGQERYQQIIQDAASGAYAADTPEKWQQFATQFQQTHPEFEVPPFQARDVLIHQALSVQDQLAQRNSDRSYELQAQAAGRKDIPSGFQAGANGGLQPIPGGPADPGYQTQLANAKGASFLGMAGDGSDGTGVLGGPGAAASVSDAAFGPPGTRNDQFLAQLSPEAQGIVKGLTNYELDISKISSIRGDQRLKLAAAAKMYDPTFDMTQYQARAAMRKSITSGNYANALNAANLVIQHVDALRRAAAQLQNSNFQPWNAISNTVKGQTGDPAITQFNTAADAVAAEAAKVFKGTGVSDVQSIQEWRKNLSPNSSPAQIDAATRTLVGDLLKSRIDTIAAQFAAAMGHPADFTFLTPHSRDVLQGMGIDPSSLDLGAQGAQGAQGAPPQAGGSDDIDMLIQKYAP